VGACARVVPRFFRAPSTFLRLHADHRVVVSKELVMYKLRVRCKVFGMTDLADDVPKEFSTTSPIC